jgi:hypothetical protein
VTRTNRQIGRRRAALGLVAAVLALTGVATFVASGGADDGGRVTAAPGAAPGAATDAPSRAALRASTQVGARDGSLGDADSKLACTLLTQAEIEAQFGGPVGDPTPLYPYCQWLVGDDAFIAVQIYRQPINEARNFHPVRFDTAGLGDDGGYIATTRAVFFGKIGVTYSILWQKVGDFTTVETERLSALAQAVLPRV